MITKYGPKAAIWIIGGLGPVIALLFTLLPMVDPRRRNYDRLGSRYNLLAGGVNLFLLMMTGLIIATLAPAVCGWKTWSLPPSGCSLP